MGLGNPIEAWLQMAQAKNQNRNQMNQDIAGIGQGLGESFGSIEQMVGEQKKKQLLQQIVQSMKMQGAPQQGPQLPGVGMAGASQPPASGMGGPPQDNTSQIDAMITQYNPELGMKAAMEKQDPYKNALIGLYKSETEKNLRPPKPSAEFSPVGGMLSKNGKPLVIDKFSGTIREGEVPATPTTGAAGGMADVRKKQFTLMDLPSNQGAQTAGGAASQVKVAARQGKALIAKPGSYQRLGLATGDAARAVLRNTPTDEAMRNANFSNTFISRVNRMKQTLTDNPSAIDNPKIRKEMYDIFNEMDQSATPFIQRQLDNMTDAGFDVTPNMRKRELGDTLPDIPFDDGAGGASSLPVVGGVLNGQKIVKVEPL